MTSMTRISIDLNLTSMVVVVGIKQTGAVLYFNIPVDALRSLLPSTGPMGRDQFLAAWKSVNDAQEVSKEVQL